VGEAAAEATEGEREGRRRRRRRGGRREEAGPESAAPAGELREAPVDEALAPSGETREPAPMAERMPQEGRATAAPIAGTPTPEAAEVAAARVAAAPMAPHAVPAVPHFDLPTQELQQLADGAGLQWVHSDADKVRLVQQAIAAEPLPVHEPRERKPVVLADEGPLVLVETRKDLSQFALPFERQDAAQPALPPQ
jgi:ribonuclease E